MKRLLAGLVCAILLGGCSAIPADVEDLLDAPRLSDTQYQVDKALREQVGREIKLKYPQSGSYRSAFTFYDIDGDGLDEAVALHSHQSGGNAQITIMDQDSGQWLVEKTFPGLSPDIDFIRFERLDSGPGPALVIGWRPESGQKIVAAYRYQDRQFSILGSEGYSQLAIEDFDGDGKSEILVVSEEPGSTPFLTYLGERDGLLDVLDNIPLERRISDFQPPVTGLLAPGMPGVALDCFDSQGRLCTVAVRVDGDELLLPLEERDGDLFADTVRSGGEDGVYTQDVTGDGVIDIPLQVTPPGYDRLDEESRVVFTRYVNLGTGGFSTALRALVNPAAGFRFVMPDRWFSGSEAVTATRQAGSAEITFFLLGSGGISDRSRELLRLQVVDLQAPPRQFDAGAYFLLGRRGGFEYYARIPSGKGEEGYSLTKTEVLSLFQFL